MSSGVLCVAQGCMGAVHVGGLLLPFFTEQELFVGNTAALLAAQPHYALLYVPPPPRSTCNPSALPSPSCKFRTHRIQIFLQP